MSEILNNKVTHIIDRNLKLKLSENMGNVFADFDIDGNSIFDIEDMRSNSPELEENELLNKFHDAIAYVLINNFDIFKPNVQLSDDIIKKHGDLFYEFKRDKISTFFNTYNEVIEANNRISKWSSNALPSSCNTFDQISCDPVIIFDQNYWETEVRPYISSGFLEGTKIGHNLSFDVIKSLQIYAQANYENSSYPLNQNYVLAPNETVPEMFMKPLEEMLDGYEQIQKFVDGFRSFACINDTEETIDISANTQFRISKNNDRSYRLMQFFY